MVDPSCRDVDRGHGLTPAIGRFFKRIAAIGLALFPLVPELVAREATHPLDPLTLEEIRLTTAILKREDRVDGDSRFVYISLEEPPKDQVYRWKPGGPLHRRAFVVLRSQDGVTECTVDLKARGLERCEEIAGVEHRLLLDEYALADEIIKGDPDWQASMRRRGYTNFDEIRNIHYFAGTFGEEEGSESRLLHVVSYDEGRAANFWGRPIEGVLAIVDLREKRLIEVVDSGVVPVATGPVELDRESNKAAARHVAPVQSSSVGAGFAVEGHEVSWERWKFHLRVDPRTGPILSLVRYHNGGRERHILYQAMVSEMFVPYMDPSAAWHARTYFDIGDYGLGLALSSIQPGAECPANCTLLDAVLHDDTGEPEVYEGVLAIFERSIGDPAWRHYNYSGDVTETRGSRELVVRSIATLGNYDYLLDWVFRQDGSIRIAVGSTGVPAVKGVPSGSPGAYGRTVDEGLVAIHHDHFFSFRLDLDVDGPRNSFEKGALKTRRVGDESPRASIWTVEPQIAHREADAQLDIDLRNPSIWRILNPNVVGKNGYPSSYLIRPGRNAVPLLSRDDYPQRRAAFTEHHLWITPHHPRERYAAGDYPSGSTAGEGLPKWTQANRPIENIDIIAWYTMGFHHVVRAEDWPVMPLTWNGFELRPFDFFSRNPVIDLP